MDKPDSISIVAHKIRTPLTVITATVNNFLDGVFGTMTPIQIPWLKKLDSHARHLEDLTNQILNLLKEQPERAAFIEQSLDRATQEANLKKITSNQQPSNVNASIPNKKTSHKILVVDDEVDVQEVVQDGLSMQGYTVIAASDAEQGFALALKEKPDVILMDLYLKDQNGLDVAERIKKEISTFIPIVMITGQDDLREKVSRFQHHADDLLAKPFQITELAIRVGSMIRLKELSDRLQSLKQSEAS